MKQTQILMNKHNRGRDPTWVDESEEGPKSRFQDEASFNVAYDIDEFLLDYFSQAGW